MSYWARTWLVLLCVVARQWVEKICYQTKNENLKINLFSTMTQPPNYFLLFIKVWFMEVSWHVIISFIKRISNEIYKWFRKNYWLKIHNKLSYDCRSMILFAKKIYNFDYYDINYNVTSLSIILYSKRLVKRFLFDFNLTCVTIFKLK